MSGNSSKLRFTLDYLLGTLVSFGRERPGPKVGELAPLFGSTDQHGRPWHLGEWIGRKHVLLYFYPRDETPGCTAEACGWRDRLETLARDNVVVVGVSFDSAASHLRFIERHQLQFTLLADEDGKIADAYGVRLGGGAIARRVSYLIALDGRIAHVTDALLPGAHLQEMAAAIAALPPSAGTSSAQQ